MALILFCRFRSCRYSHYYRYSVTSSVVSHQNLHCGYRDNLNPSHRHHFNKQFTMWIYDNYINVRFLLSFVWIYCKRINTSAQKRLWWVRTLAVSSEVRGQGLRSEVEVGVGGQGSEVRGGLRVRNELQFCFQLLHLHSIVQFCILTHHCASTCRHIRVQVGSHQFDIDRNPFVCFWRPGLFYSPDLPPVRCVYIESL